VGLRRGADFSKFFAPIEAQEAGVTDQIVREAVSAAKRVSSGLLLFRITAKIAADRGAAAPTTTQICVIFGGPR